MNRSRFVGEKRNAAEAFGTGSDLAMTSAGSSTLRVQAALVTVVLVMSTACSYVEQFFVINTSSGPLVGLAAASSYATNTGERVCAFPLQTRRLGVLPAERVGGDYIALHLTAEPIDVTFDEVACSVRVSIQPHMAVLLWSASNGRRTPFLERVELVGQRHRPKIFEGHRVAQAFRKRSKVVYVIEYP